MEESLVKRNIIICDDPDKIRDYIIEKNYEVQGKEISFISLIEPGHTKLIKLIRDHQKFNIWRATPELGELGVANNKISDEDPISILENKLSNITVKPDVDIINIVSNKMNDFISYYSDFHKNEMKSEMYENASFFNAARTYRERILNYPIGFSSIGKRESFSRTTGRVIKKTKI